MGTLPTLRLLHPLRGLLKARHSQNMFFKINYHDTRRISCGIVKGGKKLVGAVISLFKTPHPLGSGNSAG